MDREQAKAEWVRAALHEYEGALIRYAAQITGDLERARDVVQDTFLKLCAEDPARLDGHLREWLFTVCRNRARDVVRKEHRMKPLEDARLEITADGESSPADQAAANENSRQMERLVAALPDNQREVVRLKFQSGLSYKEISKVTDLSVSDVGFLIHTAMKTLRAEMQKEEGFSAS
ncbi:MAG: sigma-70 family RNA polymerase sigma factor [Verrucomicrobiota bacterium]